MSSALSRGALLLVWVGLWTTPATPQGSVPPGAVPRCESSEGTGEIAGVVRDSATGEPIGGVDVFLGGTACHARTGDSGAYRLTHVPAGRYTLYLRQIGFKTDSSEVTVRAGHITRFDASLAHAVVDIDHDSLTGFRTLQEPSLSSFAWLAGCWGATQDGVEMEEHWTAPKGGILLGVHRDVFASGRVFFEFLRIERRPDGIFYVAQPRGRAPTEFRLVESSEMRAVFANPEHDFPQRILYRLDDAGALHARIEGEEDGEARSAEWTWPRVPCDSR